MKNKILLILTLLIAFSTSVRSQGSRKRLVLPDDSEVTYNIKDNSFNGPYFITNKGSVVITRGSYANDLRIGNWYFFNTDGTVFLRYNYDLKKILALDDKALAFANVKIVGNNEANTASIPIPLMAIEQYVDLLSALVKQKIPSVIKDNISKLDVQVIADIDEAGKATYMAKYKLDNIENAQNFDLVGQKYSVSWIPASLANVNYKSQFAFNITLVFSEEKTNTDNQKRFRWN